MTEGDPISLKEYLEQQLDELRRAVEAPAQSQMVPLRDHLQSLIDRNEVLLETLVRASSERFTTFEETVTRRFAEVNEFRGALDDLGKQMATRRELETAVSALGIRIDEKARQISELRSRVDSGPAQLHELQSRADLLAGRQQGIGVSTGVLVGAISALGALISIVVVLSNVLT